MRAPAVRALGFVSGWGRGSAALPDDARAAARGRAVLSLGRPALEGERFRRTTREGLLGLAAVEAMLADAEAPREAIAGERTALLYVTTAAYGASNRRFIEQGGGGIYFASTAPAVVSSEVAIEYRLTGPYTVLVGGPPETLRAIWYGAVLLERGACDRALVLAVETFEECADLYRRARRLTGWPLVEAAACLWLEPGAGVLRLESRRGGGRPDPQGVRRRLGETLACEPLAALDLCRAAGLGEAWALAAGWRGETARLQWTGATPVTDTRAGRLSA